MQPLIQAAAAGLKKAKGNELKAIVGKLADAESIIALKVRSPKLNSWLAQSSSGTGDSASWQNLSVLCALYQHGARVCTAGIVVG